jgi:hypothetical protein
MEELMRIVGKVLRLVLLVALLGVVAVGASVATAVSPTLFALVADTVEPLVAEQMPEVQTVRGAQAAEIAALKVAHEAELERARGPVQYRGEEKTVREAIRDTAERMAVRLAEGKLWRDAALPGLALPVVGVTVAAAAAAHDAADACALAGDLAALTAAFEMPAPGQQAMLCAGSVPAPGALWAQAVAEPERVRAEAEAVAGPLPPLDRALWSELSAFVGALID